MGKAAFRRGLGHGVPIALGYLSVAFAFGIQAAGGGLTPLQAVLISMTNLTSAGQVAGLSLMVAGAPLYEMALTQLVINLRYALMSLSLSQRLDAGMTTPWRALLAFGNTDEIFAVCGLEISDKVRVTERSGAVFSATLCERGEERCIKT